MNDCNNLALLYKPNSLWKEERDRSVSRLQGSFALMGSCLFHGRCSPVRCPAERRNLLSLHNIVSNLFVLRNTAQFLLLTHKFQDIASLRHLIPQVLLRARGITLFRKLKGSRKQIIFYQSADAASPL